MAESPYAGLTRWAGAAALCLAVPGTAGAQVTPAFDWSVPARYGPNGMAGLALPLTDTAATRRILNPEASIDGQPAAGWPADFNACASASAGDTFIWSVDGQRVSESSACTTQLRFPREGRYRVELTVLGASGVQGTTAQDINIQDFLIIGLGDSYGSGEGVPNVPVSPDALTDFEFAQRAVDDVQAAFRAAEADVARAQAEVAAAQAELDAARSDRAALSAAWEAYNRALQALAAAQAELNAANAAVATATAAVTAAQAKVVFECAQWWDPAGCTAARRQLDSARAAKAAALARRDRAVAARDSATIALASATAALPLEGYEYASGVIDARIAVSVAQLGVATTALDAARQVAEATRQALDESLSVLHQRAGGAVAIWQDSTPVQGRLLLPEAPYYEPHAYSQCHQSKFSAQALAALVLEQQDPKTSVTFVHLACSGATITKGLLGAYGGIEEPRAGTSGPRPAQLDMAAALTTGREIDALVTSVGGNDVGFSDTLITCASKEPCYLPSGDVLSDAQIDDYCDTLADDVALFPSLLGNVCTARLRAVRDRAIRSDVESEFLTNLEALPGMYGDVQARIQTLWPGLPADRMVLTPYPIFTRDHNGDLCGFEQDIRTNLPGVTTSEFFWAEQVPGRLLNDTIVGQQGALGWTIVQGVPEGARLHGYCSADSWIVRLQESLATQLGLTGTAHPNLAGQQATAARIASTLLAAFYPGSTEHVRAAARVDGR